MTTQRTGLQTLRPLTLLTLCLALVMLCGCPKGPADDDVGGDDDDEGPDDDDTSDDDDTYIEETWPPDEALFRTHRESFNTDYYVVLEDGQIQVKPNAETTGLVEHWQLLGSTGKPEGSQLDNWGAPSSVAEISCDGVHLMALSDDGHFYRGSDMTTNIHQTFIWTDLWGGIMADGTGLSAEWSTEFGWSVADSHPFGVAYYEDGNGTQHDVGLGVAHLYRLGPHGRRVYFNDWWLPNDWSRQICGPERGTLNALNISASASTMFVVGEQGELYTRLYDFDTGGENRLLTYSYIIQGASGTTRKLPAEDWVQQPNITEGFFTPDITIYQNGQGNAARVLRVEGVRDGVTGYFHKGIQDGQWSFQETGRHIGGPILNDPDNPPHISPEVDPSDYSLSGTLALDGNDVQIQLLDFNMVCSPATAQLTVDGQVLTVGGAPLQLEFHHVHTWVQEQRPANYWEQGMPGYIQAALLIPDEIDSIDDLSARSAMQNLFGSREVINFLGYASLDYLELDEIGWLEPFRVPGDEKAFLSAFSMTVVTD